MVDISIEQLDNLFKSYNYQVSRSSTSEIRIYTLRYGMYHAAELIKLNENADVTQLKNEFSQLGYATEVRSFSNKNEIEEYLFEGFFIKTPLGNELKRRYKLFVNKQLKNLPKNSQYQYINSSFNILLQNEQQAIIESQNYDASKGSIALIDKINELIVKTENSIFIIIEAPAGFGKTCTAYEILNNFSTVNSKKLPFFSELSRNKEARIFKHILLNEIDEQFPIGIKKNIVIDQITKGRIPLIIDGFDELISRKSTKEEVESMLTTILELLKGKAKIIVTTRKTALFSSDEFFKSIDQSINDFSIARIEIKEPTIENWLNPERIQIIKSNDFPLENIENPVLLSYLRNISTEKFNEYLSTNSDKTIIDKYIDYLLKREQRRQNIKLSTQEQFNIFKNLVRFMTEYHFTADSKETIKDFIKDFNHKPLARSLNDYIPEEKPSYEELAETISNHAFLDRKQNGDIGIINDFIFGILVADNLISGDYERELNNFNEIIPIDFACKAVQSYKIQSNENKLKLWSAFNNKKYVFNYDVLFFFQIDYFFKKAFNRSYVDLIIDDWHLRDIEFSGESRFSQSVFSHITFTDCFFDLKNFNQCTFQNCTFNNCSIIPNPCKKKFNDFAIFACTDDNSFLSKVSERIHYSKSNEILLNDYIILKKFFYDKSCKPIPRKISYLRKILSQYPDNQINEKISLLRKNHYIFFKNDLIFVSKSGVEQFKKLKNLIA